MFSHHLDVGPFPSNFIFYYVSCPVLRVAEKLGLSMEVLDFFKNNIIKFQCFFFQVQGKGIYPLGIDDPPYSIDFCVIPFF